MATRGIYQQSDRSDFHDPSNTEMLPYNQIEVYDSGDDAKPPNHITSQFCDYESDEFYSDEATDTNVYSHVDASHNKSQCIPDSQQMQRQAHVSGGKRATISGTSRVLRKNVPPTHNMNGRVKKTKAPNVDRVKEEQAMDIQEKLNVLKNENIDLKRQLNEVKLELKTMRRQNKIQDKEMNKIVNREADNPSMLQRLNSDIHVLQSLLRTNREKCDQLTQKNKQLDAELTKTKQKLAKLQILSEDNSLMERDLLARRVSTLQVKLEYEEKRTQELEKNLELTTKNHKHELTLEVQRQKDVRKQYVELKKKFVDLESQLKEKVKLLELNNIYSKRHLKGAPPHHLPITPSHNPGDSGSESSMKYQRPNLASAARRLSLGEGDFDKNEEMGKTKSFLSHAASLENNSRIGSTVGNGLTDSYLDNEHSSSQLKPPQMKKDKSDLTQKRLEKIASRQREQEEMEKRLKNELLEQLKSLENEMQVVSQRHSVIDKRFRTDLPSRVKKEMESNDELDLNASLGTIEREKNLFVTQIDQLMDDSTDSEAISHSGAIPWMQNNSAAMLHQGAPGLMAKSRNKLGSIPTAKDNDDISTMYMGESLDIEEFQL